MEVESKEVQTLEDEISDEFCICGHEISEHYIGILTGTSKCCALLYNGAIWSSCNCDRLSQRPFEIVILVPDYANNTQTGTYTS